MIALIQRVKAAQVSVEGKEIGSIQQGLVVLLGVETADKQHNADRLCQKILGYRVFNDDEGKMNLSIQQLQGEILVVSQFTLVADTEKGMRPSFSKGASHEQAKYWYDYVVTRCRHSGLKIATGSFAAEMQVALINDGPTTFWLQA